jgi:CHAT domain-containing protein
MTYLFQNDFEKAMPLFYAANKIFIHALKSQFPSLSENEKQQFLQLYGSKLERFNSFALKLKQGYPDVTGEMYDNQLFTKSLLFSSARKVRHRIMNSGDSSLISLYEEWHSQRQYLTRMYKLTVEQRRKRGVDLLKLEEESNVLEKKLSARSQHFATGVDSVNHSWKEIRERLKANEAAIEMVRFRKFHKSFSDTIYYGALIVTKTSVVPELVLFENGKEMENKELMYYRNSTKGKIANTRSYNIFWKPVAEKLRRANVNKVYFSPDGVYHSINLNTLQDPDTKKFVLDQYEIRITGNTKGILTETRLSSAVADATLFGFPNYQGNETSPASTSVASVRVPQLDGIKRFFQNGMIESLPGTREEVINIGNILAGKKVKVKDYQGLTASETAIKQINSPAVLHIATHGFFLGDLPDTEEQGFAGFENKKFIENPMLRSGLLLAGSQKTFNNPEQTDEAADDGILTAYEAATLNLDRTDLVVLSACETGLGEIRNGEGVYGLQRAFQSAGAKFVLMSLWKVDDRATQTLMTSFYKEMLRSSDKQKALIKAQISLRKQYKDPYYWGAFVLVGN